MRFLNQTAASYVGVDLHARTLYVCVLDSAGTLRLSRNLPAKPDPFLQAIAPFRDLPPIPWRPTAIELVTFDADEVGGLLRTEALVRLG